MGWYSRFETRLQPTKIKTQKVSIMNQVGLSTVVRERGSIAKEAMHACYHFSFIVGRSRNRLMPQS